MSEKETAYLVRIIKDQRGNSLWGNTGEGEITGSSLFRPSVVAIFILSLFVFTNFDELYTDMFADLYVSNLEESVDASTSLFLWSCFCFHE